jgi:hypothetical protein
MIGITTEAVDDSATHIDLNSITAGVFKVSTSTLSLFRLQKNGRAVVQTVTGQQAADLYNALVKIKAGTYTTI